MSNINTMSYETTPVKNIKAKTAKKHLLKDMDNISTGMILFYLAKRHAMFLVSSWAIFITLVWAFPPLPSLILSLFGK